MDDYQANLAYVNGYNAAREDIKAILTRMRDNAYETHEFLYIDGLDDAIMAVRDLA